MIRSFKTLLAAALLAAVCRQTPAQTAAVPLQVPDTMAQRMQACTVCHGKEGRATSDGYFPRIAGKPAGYLHNQLVNFRDNRRRYATMTYLVEHMSDAYLRDIARYFAELDLPYPPAQPTTAAPAQLQRGQALVRQGDATRRVPACAACHGERLTGVEPAIPGLLGLPRDYLLGQLGAWRNGQRHAAQPDCMGDIVQRLSLEDLSAVATWLSAQTPPADAHPARQIALPLPMDCGSGLK